MTQAVLLIPNILTAVLGVAIVISARNGPNYTLVVKIVAMLGAIRGIELGVAFLTNSSATAVVPTSITTTGSTLWLTWGVIRVAILTWALAVTLYANRDWRERRMPPQERTLP